MEGQSAERDAVFSFRTDDAQAPACVAAARRFVDRTLGPWGAAEQAFDTQLVVSELVTNAMRHGGGAGLLRLLGGGGRLVCVVSDHNRATPVSATPDTFSEYGRGLHLVDALCSAWGWLVPRDSGKLVWAIVSD
ncbi:ATP-binding protein [Nonomuraea maritima]|jgi:anti-sigma regulatory factor (Ser/Thr protein kinase)|nr:ATP-binding protein [Nonomuraea maritima]